MSYCFSGLERAFGAPVGRGVIKQQTADFIVDEIMPVEPSGEGEHLWLWIRKTASNTEWVARQLARVADVRPRDVSYAGLKDRQAITSQWFSIHLPGREDPDLTQLDSNEFEVLRASRHDRKLRRGAHSGNRFSLRIRQLEADPVSLQQRLQQIRDQGVPNYFGAQRFGHDMQNLVQAEQLFSGARLSVSKHQRGLYLSAARAWVFNQYLSQRVSQGCWNRPLAGDVFQLQGKSACFVDDGSADLGSRIELLDIHPTGPLWGRGELLSEADCRDQELQLAEQYPAFCAGLEKAGMKQERRALRLLAEQMDWQLEAEDVLRVSFNLPAGAFATMVMRELLSVDEAVS